MTATLSSNTSYVSVDELVLTDTECYLSTGSSSSHPCFCISERFFTALYSATPAEC